jgi:hypothetical protein
LVGSDAVVLQELLSGERAHGELTPRRSPSPEGHMTEPSQSDKADLRNGISDSDLADGAMLVGRVGDEQVLLAGCPRCTPESDRARTGFLGV